MNDIAEHGFKKVAVLGLGLIGGSFAFALHEKYPEVEITAYVRKPGIKPTFIEFAATPADAVKGADLILIATPPGTFADVAKHVALHLKEGAVVTDVGSVKVKAISAIAPQLPGYVHYVPGHPIAGKAQSGFTAAEASLFRGKKVILTPDGKSHAASVSRVSQLWQELGAQVEEMSPHRHDRIYAYVSHLPQIVAFAMAPVLAAQAEVPGEQYRQFTRLMASDAGLWAEICVANAANLATCIDDFNLHLQTIIEKDDKPSQAMPTLAAFAKIIGECLHRTASAVPAGYAGTGLKDMTALMSGPGEKTVSDEAVGMCRELSRRMKEIRMLLSDRNALREAFLKRGEEK